MAPPARAAIPVRQSDLLLGGGILGILTVLVVPLPAMLLDFLNQSKAAAAINQACRDIVADKKNHTRDLGGTANTAQFTDAIIGKLESSSVAAAL